MAEDTLRAKKLSEATGTRWEYDKESDTYRVTFGTQVQADKAIGAVSAVVKREFGRSDEVTKGTDGDLTITADLARQIVDRYEVLRMQDALIGDKASRFKRGFANAVAEKNEDVVANVATELAAIARNSGFRDTRGSAEGKYVILAFSNAQEADRFSDYLAAARKRAGISDSSLPIDLSRDGTKVMLERDALVSISASEGDAFLRNAARVSYEETEKLKWKNDQPEKNDSSRPLPKEVMAAALKAVTFDTTGTKSEAGDPQLLPNNGPSTGRIVS